MGFEVILILLIGWLLLGPKQAAWLTQTVVKWMSDAQATATQVTRQIDLELARREAEVRRANAPQPDPASDAATLPNAYLRFREEFPDEDPLAPPTPTPTATAPRTDDTTA